MVKTRSGDAPMKQAKLEDFKGGDPGVEEEEAEAPRKPNANAKSTSRSNGTTSNKKSRPATVATTATAGARNNQKSSSGGDNLKRKRTAKAHQPPTPPPVESIPSVRPEEEGRPRKVPKGSVPSDPVGAARRAAETRRNDPRGAAAPEAGSVVPRGGKKDADETGGGDDDDDDDDDNNNNKTQATSPKQDPILMINRSPVLTLWAACVTAFVHPEIKWEGCLSAGAAIAALCAVSKGRAIGKIEPKKKEEEGDEEDRDEEESKSKRKRKAKAQSDTQTIHVMHFPLQLKTTTSSTTNTTVLVGGKPKTQSEDTLVTKFGGRDAYEAVKAAMEKGLQSWKGGKNEDSQRELDGKAFGMYEKFRPRVPQGGRGWGRKGELRLERIEEVVGRC